MHVLVAVLNANASRVVGRFEIVNSINMLFLREKELRCGA